MSAPTYDTGLAKPQRTMLRAAIAARLSPLLVANGGYLRAVMSLPRPLAGSSEIELDWFRRAFQGQTPCIAIALGSKKHQPAGLEATEVRGELEVAIYVASTNQRDLVAGRLEADISSTTDPKSDPGVDAMLEHVEELLLGQNFVLVNGAVSSTTSELKFESEEEVYTDGNLTVWGERATLLVERPINPDRLITQLMTEIQTTTSIEGADPANPIVTTDQTLGAP